MRQLAVIREAKSIEHDRTGETNLYFSTYISEAAAASHWFPPAMAGEFLAAYGSFDPEKLNGKVCWVDVDDNIIKVIGPALI